MVTEIDVIIPVHNNVKYTEPILGMLAQQTIKPKRVILIDNASTDETPFVAGKYSNQLPLKYIRNDRNVGVNVSWNQGIAECESPLIAILNNDLIIPNFFLEKMIDIFEQCPEVGAAVPNTLQGEAGKQHTIDAKNTGENRIEPLGWREGWAFVIRRTIILKAGPIPYEIVTFYGDDYLFGIVEEQNFSRVKLIDLPIYHYLSQTLYCKGGAEHFGDDEQNWRIIRDSRTAGNRPDGLEEWSKFMAKKAIRHWTAVPMATDMACYAPFYQKAVADLLETRKRGQRKTFVELGTRYGCSARIILSAIPARDNFKLILIDPIRFAEVEELIDDVQVEFWTGTAEQYANQFKEDSIDFLHVDVDPHEYEQTKNIFELYKTKIKQGGVLIFHDASYAFGVLQFVQELAKAGGWQVAYCEAHTDMPIAVPAKAIKL